MTSPLQEGAPDDQQRWFGTGYSLKSASWEAGAEAAKQAYQDDDAKLVIVFAAIAHDLEQMLAGVRSVTSEVPLIGCTTAGELTSSSPGASGVSVTILGGGFSVDTASAPIGDDLFDAASAVSECGLHSLEREHHVLLMLSDGLAGDQQQVVRGAYATLGVTVPLVGGCAGDDLAMEQTKQFFNGQVLESGIVAASIASDAPLGIGVRHGWSSVGEPMVVTHSSGTTVTELDGMPALQAYGARLGLGQDVLGDSGAFADFALTHPLGIHHRGHEEVRFVTGADVEAGSISCIAEVPQGGLVWIMEGDIASVMAGTAAATNDALSMLGDAAPIGVLAFDCIARRGVLGEDRLLEEFELITECAKGAPVSGFYTYGEFARTMGSRGFHSQTLVALAIG